MLDIAGEHVQRIKSTLNGEGVDARASVVAPSWKRSACEFRIDPMSTREPQVLTFPELSGLREKSEILIRAAQPEIDRLYQIVRPTRFVVLLTDQNGVVIDHRGAGEDADDFKRWGMWLGRVWSEDIEGTNGIGTALVEGRPATVHRSQHFRVRHADLSCAGAPICDPEGKPIGLIDVSSFDPTLSEHAHTMAGTLTIAVARGIEERLFRAQFQREWVIAVACPDNPRLGMLLAVNDDRRIVGANRDARAAFALKGHDLDGGLSLWTVFTRNDDLFRRRNSGDTSGQLICGTTGQSWPAILTPPLPAFVSRLGLEADSLVWRPRIDALLAGNRPPPAELRLGLTPAALRRVREHVESHLDGDLSLKTLSGIAGLSISHFARAFRQSEGMTPHAFVLERRLAQARKLLLDTKQPLSEIAHAVGFADQSHFARHFRRLTGIAPSEFRRSQTG